MSVRHIAAVLEQPLPPNLKMVAVVYANSANDEDSLVWLSVARVSERSGYSERHVQSLIRELEALEVLEPVELADIPAAAWERFKGIPTRYRPTVYRLNPHGRGANISPLPPGVKSAPARGEPQRAPGVNPSSPKSEGESESEPAPWHATIRYTPIPGWLPRSQRHTWAIPGGPERPNEVVDLLWDAVVSACHIDTSQLPATARSVLNRSVEELRKVGADPVEIQRRAARYLAGKGPVPAGTKLTHRALVVHWPALGDPDAAPAHLEGLDQPAHTHRFQENPNPEDGLGGWCAGCKRFENELAGEAGLTPGPEEAPHE